MEIRKANKFNPLKSTLDKSAFGRYNLNRKGKKDN